MAASPPTASENTMHSKQTKMSSGLWVLLLAIAGCGQTVELDQPGKLTPSSNPDVLGTVREQVIELRVDDERVYWLTSSGAVRGCNKQRCAGSVVTYAEQVNWLGSFVIQEGELFYATSGFDQSVRAVDLADPTQSRKVASDFTPTAMAVDSERLYLVNDVNVRIVPLSPRSDDAVITIPTTDVGFIAPAIAANGDYVYWFEGTDRDLDLKRARNDVVSVPETLATDLTVDRYFPPQSAGNLGPGLGLAVDGSYVYWSENVLAGAIKRLSISGGKAEPETVVEPIRFPMGLLIEGANLFVEHETDAYEYAVSGCRLGDCAPRPLAHELANTDVFALDEAYLYTATTSQNLDPDVPRDHPVCVLRRSSREMGAHSP
jgi:hypothetical protein